MFLFSEKEKYFNNKYQDISCKKLFTENLQKKPYVGDDDIQTLYSSCM